MTMMEVGGVVEEDEVKGEIGGVVVGAIIMANLD